MSVLLQTASKVILSKAGRVILSKAGNVILSKTSSDLSKIISGLSTQFQISSTTNNGGLMSVSLQKGGNVSLSKADPNLSELIIGLGWDTRATDGVDFDLDGSAFLLTSTGKVRSDADFIFYNNLRSNDGSIEHTGDNRTGEGEGDDESLIVHLNKLPTEIERIAITVTIHEAEARKQSFGQVSNAFIRCVNKATNMEIARFDLTEDASVETAMIFGEIYRHNGEWKFRAIGQGFKGGLAALARHYGINV